MILNRQWATPLAAGAFFLTAMTGILIFFHLDSGLNKLAHEWLSWVLLAGVIFHLITNLNAFKRYFNSRAGLAIMGAFILLLGLSFISPGEKREPPFVASVRTLANLPLGTLAMVAGQSTEQVSATLRREGLSPSQDTQSLQELAGPDTRRQARLLEKVFNTKTPR